MDDMRGVTQKSTQSISAVHNRRLAVQLLRHHGVLSRQQLAQITGLRNSTLTYIVRELLENKVVRTVGKAESKTVGKKQLLLEINPDLGWVVGISIDRDSLTLSYLDAAGKVLDQTRMPTGHSAEQLPRQLATSIRAWATAHDASMKKLLGVGIGTPGVVDYTRGVLLTSTWLNANNFPMARLVSEALGVPVLVDNDANYAALAEAYQGSARDLGTFIYFFVSSQQHHDVIQIYGLGSTYFIDHKLHRGVHFGAGEVDDFIEPNPSEYVTPDQLKLLAQPDAPLTPELTRIGNDLAHTMSSVVNLIDPEAVILGGNVTISNTQIQKAIESAINQTIVSLPNRYVEVRGSTYRDFGSSMGAAFAVIDAIQIVESEPAGVGQVSPNHMQTGVANPLKVNA